MKWCLKPWQTNLQRKLTKFWKINDWKAYSISLFSSHPAPIRFSDYLLMFESFLISHIIIHKNMWYTYITGGGMEIVLSHLHKQSSSEETHLKKLKKYKYGKWNYRFVLFSFAFLLDLDYTYYFHSRSEIHSQENKYVLFEMLTYVSSIYF